jgi:oxygen-independent coproporphyrinogen III oxidase
MPKALYIHIPFCTNKCYYCDFNSYVTENQQLVWEYLYALEKEMEATVMQIPQESLTSIFVGGGTPTFLSSEQMEYFLNSVQQYFPKQAQGMEFTMEANPGTTDLEKLLVMKKGGVNRLSFGVQSFDDELLKAIGRIHDSQQVFVSLENARKAGFDNISIDLIFGLPDQTTEIFQKTLDIAFTLGLQHFSAYSLKVEENTLFHVLYEKNQLALPPEEDEVKMYEMVMEQMEKHGYHQYEISNFAKPGYQSVHNKTYWKNEEYYGVGAGAHGYARQRRHVNSKPVLRYIQLTKEKGLPRIEDFPVTERERMEEFMIMGLRLLEGVSQSEFYERYKQPMMQAFGTELTDLNHAGLIETAIDRVRLTKRGILLGNEVFVRFLQ